MTPYDPYQAPSTAYAPMAQPTGNAPITPAMIESLRSAKSWIRLLSILGFIGSGLMVLSGLFMLVVGVLAPVRRSSSAAFTPLVGLMYFPFALIYLVPSISMHRYASAIDRLLTGVSAQAMEEALASNHSFWRTAGIMALVVIAFSILMVLGIIVAAVVVGPTLFS